jgi:hypothetical protein
MSTARWAVLAALRDGPLDHVATLAAAGRRGVAAPVVLAACCDLAEDGDILRVAWPDGTEGWRRKE